MRTGTKKGISDSTKEIQELHLLGFIFSYFIRIRKIIRNYMHFIMKLMIKKIMNEVNNYTS